jgi:hypothetical protein
MSCCLLLLQRGHDVWGCYMSPVADAYGKQGLAPVGHRLQMCSLAAAGTDNVMVDTWEATRPGYTRTLEVRQGVEVVCPGATSRQCGRVWQCVTHRPCCGSGCVLHRALCRCLQLRG